MATDVMAGQDRMLAHNALPVRPQADLDEPDSPIMEEDEDDDALPQLHLPPKPSSRPDGARARTEPNPSTLLHGFLRENHSQRPGSSHSRNRSPYGRTHWRSRSTGAGLSGAPKMERAHSMPNPHGYTSARPFDAYPSTASSSGSLSPNPFRTSPVRPRSPFRTAQEEMQRSPSGGAIEAIQEDSELDITPRAVSQPSPSIPSLSPFSRSNPLRTSRRPASPLHSQTNAPPPFAPQASFPASFPASVIDQNVQINMNPNPNSASNSPALGPQRFNEPHPASLPLHYTSSTGSFSSISMPSTPSSARSRSRSPSISSLETIEDAPEQEETEALRFEAEIEQESSDGEEGPRRRSFEGPRGFGFARAGRTERKRWSVCGGERRADLDLETIWED